MRGLKMEYTDNNLQELKKSAFNYALYTTENIEVANDISSEVISSFLLNYQVDRNEMGWIINATKNYCKKYFSNIKRSKKIVDSYRNEIMTTLEQHAPTEENIELKRAFTESFNALTANELKTILYFFQCNENIKQMNENIGGSYASLRVKISRIKRKLQAETYKRLGFIGSKKIVTPQLNDTLIKFLKSFKENLEADTIEKMYYYFSKVDLSNYKKDIQIKEILEYEIELDNSQYKAWILYTDLSDSIQSFTLEFEVDSKNQLKILSPPLPSPKLMVLETDSNQGKLLLDLMNKYPPDKSGQPSIPPEELDKLMKQLEKENKEKSPE